MTPHEREVMQLALSDFEDLRDNHKICCASSMSALRACLAQPEKEWVGLTDAEVEKVFFDMGQFAKIDLKTFARAIETKLKEKNNG